MSSGYRTEIVANANRLILIEVIGGALVTEEFTDPEGEEGSDSKVR